MQVNKVVVGALNGLKFEKQVLFGLSCTDRILELYPLFDKMVLEEELEPLVQEGTGYEILKHILETTYNLIENTTLSQDDIKERVEKCYSLAPSDEEYGDIQTTMAQFIANSLAYNLEYYLKREIKYLEWISDSVIEILNIVESEKANRKGIDIENELEVIFQNEVGVQLDIIEELKKDVDVNGLRKLVDLNRVSLMY